MTSPFFLLSCRHDSDSVFTYIVENYMQEYGATNSLFKGD